MGNTLKRLFKKIDKDYLTLAAVVLVVLGIAWYWNIAFSPLKEGLCIDPDNRHRDKLELVYLQKEECDGFRFKQMDGVTYKIFSATPKQDSAEIIIKSELPYWFSGRDIILNVNQNAEGERYKHTSSFERHKKRGSVYFDEYWGMDYNRRNYQDTPSDKSQYRGFYYFDEEHVFHGFCIFSGQDVNDHARCTLYLTLHDTILVRLSASYSEMSYAADKMKQLSTFLYSILIQQEG